MILGLDSSIDLCYSITLNL